MYSRLILYKKKNMIESFLKSASIVSIFFVIYFFIRNINIKMVKFYTFIIQIILLFGIITAIKKMDIMVILVFLFNQFLFIFFLKDFYKDDKRVRGLYELISNSNLNPIFICGLREIEDEKLEKYSIELNDFLNFILFKRSLNFGFIIVENEELTISVVLFKKNIIYDEAINHISNSEHLKIENIKKGCQIKYCIK